MPKKNINLNIENYASMTASVPFEVLLNKQLSACDIKVYILCANLTHKYGYCWATNEYIAKLTGYSLRAVKYSINKLKAFKYLVCVYKTKNNHTDRKIFDNYKAKKLQDFIDEFEYFTESNVDNFSKKELKERIIDNSRAKNCTRKGNSRAKNCTHNI